MKNLTPAQEAIVEHGVRWCINILTEIAGNYGPKLPTVRRDALGYALVALHEVLSPDPQNLQLFRNKTNEGR